MANCKTITISTCPDDSTCEACKEIIKSQCIKYTGDDLTSLGIDKGDTLNEILIQIDSIIEDISGNCDCIPQACVKLKYKSDCNNPEYSLYPCPAKGKFEQGFSCSTTVLPVGCSKSYTIFDWYGDEVESFDTIEQFNTYVTDMNNYTGDTPTLALQHGYTLVEYITCANGSSESLPVCFEPFYRRTSSNPMIEAYAAEIASSCNCCQDTPPITE